MHLLNRLMDIFADVCLSGMVFVDLQFNERPIWFKPVLDVVAGNQIIVGSFQ